jgi:UDP-N-acetylmuramate: L-alanyl-gamma-D-glutamyl-meso-diaminopimelate ligase
MEYPQQISHIHMMAICGTGMSAVAGLLKDAGYHVTGSDQNVYPPISDQLKKLNIPTMEGFRRENLTPRPDLVVVGNVISKNNPEAAALLESDIPYDSYPGILQRLFLEQRHSIVIAGTHGKTTSSTLMAYVLDQYGLDPSFMVGGIPRNFPNNYKLGQGSHFVIEGDEYDTAFFDKGPKFLHYAPKTIMLTSIEYDHADIYPNLESIRQAFRQLIALLPENGCLAACIDQPEVAKILTGVSSGRIIPYGLGPGAEVTARNISYSPSGVDFDLIIAGQSAGHRRLHSPLPGRHNLLNLLGVCALVWSLNLPLQTLADCLPGFGGVKRRQELLADTHGVRVIDDFAHHPTAIAETIMAIRSQYPARRIWAIFEPRSNTTRRSVFQRDFVEAFTHENIKVILAGVDNPQKVPEDIRLKPETVIADLQARHIDARFIATIAEIVDYLATAVTPGDILLFMSNGHFGGLPQKTIAMLESRPA